MKKAIKEAPKEESSSDKKKSRPYSTKQTGYKEDVYNNEEQKTY